MRMFLFLALFSLVVFGCGGGGNGTSTGSGSTDTGGKTSSSSSGTGGAKSGTGGASSTAGASTGGASTGGAGQTATDCVPLPGKSRTYDHILNLVDPDMTTALNEYLQQPVVLPEGKEPLGPDHRHFEGGFRAEENAGALHF